MRGNIIRGQTACLGRAALTAAGAETVYDTANAIDYAINGKLYAKAAVTDGTTPTTDANTGDAFTALAASQTCVFVWLLTSDGTVKVAQGEIEDLQANDDYEDGGIPQFPAIPDDHCPFAYQVVKNKSTGSSWTFGSGNWNATGIEDLIVNCMHLPDRPQEETTA